MEQLYSIGKVYFDRHRCCNAVSSQLAWQLRSTRGSGTLKVSRLGFVNEEHSFSGMFLQVLITELFSNLIQLIIINKFN